MEKLRGAARAGQVGERDGDGEGDSETLAEGEEERERYGYTCTPAMGVVPCTRRTTRGAWRPPDRSKACKQGTGCPDGRSRTSEMNCKAPTGKRNDVVLGRSGQARPQCAPGRRATS
jgi:hypothetical protein